MVDAPVVPDGEIVGVLPAVTDLQVVVVGDEVDEPFQGVLALELGEAVDLLDLRWLVSTVSSFKR